MGLIFMAFSGLLVGAIARFLYPGVQEMSWFKTMLLGVGGAFLAGFLGSLVGLNAGIIGSVLGAMLIIFVAGKMREGRTT